MPNTDKQNLKIALKNWLTEIEQNITLASNIIAINFDLAEPYSIAMIGTSEYDPDDEDWATVNEITEPTGSVDIDNILTQPIQWEEVLNLTVEIMKELRSELKEFQLFNVQHITTGFVDGNLETIK